MKLSSLLSIYIFIIMLYWGSSKCLLLGTGFSLEVALQLSGISFYFLVSPFYFMYAVVFLLHFLLWYWWRKREESVLNRKSNFLTGAQSWCLCISYTLKISLNNCLASSAQEWLCHIQPTWICGLIGRHTSFVAMDLSCYSSLMPLNIKLLKWTVLSCISHSPNIYHYKLDFPKLSDKQRIWLGWYQVLIHFIFALNW